MTASGVRDAEVVLGIDAAWTLSQPSGVALAQRQGGVWRLAAVAPSYAAYIDETAPAAVALRVHKPDAAALIEATRLRCGRAPDLVAVDMPLATLPITGRRASDDAVSQAYGARHCSTHTPSAIRPGAISDDLSAAFGALGYPLATTAVERPSLIEVYPHPALVELTGADRRLPYKIAKLSRYWPELAPVERRKKLLAVWRQIIAHLDRELGGVEPLLPVPPLDAPGRALKAFEDMLDAVVCAWVGICVLEGRAVAFGDASSAIWIPAPRTGAGCGAAAEVQIREAAFDLADIS